ncbi:MAG: phenylacetate--CoA ligase family protein, partial [Proteobacteria bacterium]|nr:phenylacetate--CoA ligase family protein [Pseudomonadota bacterium]
MSFYTRLIASAIFPLHERLKGHSTIRALRSMEQSQWLSSNEMQALQLDRLRAFLERIGRDVPYYRDLFRAIGFSPVDVNSLTDMQRLPITGKSDIRENLERMKADNAGPLERFSTGGSSGEPLVFYRGKERVSHDVAAKWRAT